MNNESIVLKKLQIRFANQNEILMHTINMKNIENYIEHLNDRIWHVAFAILNHSKLDLKDTFFPDTYMQWRQKEKYQNKYIELFGLNDYLTIKLIKKHTSNIKQHLYHLEKKFPSLSRWWSFQINILTTTKTISSLIFINF